MNNMLIICALIVARSKLVYLVNLDVALKIFQRSLCHERMFQNT